MLSHIREEGDHIVFCLFFDLENALNGKGGFLLDILDFGGTRPSSAMASQAAISTSSHLA
jgi:hypothetical protein